MTKDSDLSHLLVAVAMLAPILMFYVFIAAEMLGYPQRAERLAYVSPAALSQICSAFAKGTLR